MCFAVLVMLVAGFTEVLRHEMCPRGEVSDNHIDLAFIAVNLLGRMRPFLIYTSMLKYHSA